MRALKVKLSIFISILAISYTVAQEAQFPIVKDFGGIYKIENAHESPDVTQSYKILIELVSAHKDPENESFWINNIARMMNLHGIAGVEKENLLVKVVVHGPAVLDIVTDERYLKEFSISQNPNTAILSALREAGVEILVCGQSLIARDIKESELFPDTKIALSALTTITKNVPNGYVLFKF